MKKYSTIQEAYKAGKTAGRIEGMYAAITQVMQQLHKQQQILAQQIQKGGRNAQQ